MSLKIGHKESPAAVLSSVIAEMAKPRVVESAKWAGKTLPTVETDLLTCPQEKRLSRLAAVPSCYRARN